MHLRKGQVIFIRTQGYFLVKKDFNLEKFMEKGYKHYLSLMWELYGEIDRCDAYSPIKDLVINFETYGVVEQISKSTESFITLPVEAVYNKNKLDWKNEFLKKAYKEMDEELEAC